MKLLLATRSCERKSPVHPAFGSVPCPDEVLLFSYANLFFTRELNIPWLALASRNHPWSAKHRSRVSYVETKRRYNDHSGLGQ